MLKMEKIYNLLYWNRHVHRIVLFYTTKKKYQLNNAYHLNRNSKIRTMEAFEMNFLYSEKCLPFQKYFYFLYSLSV